MTQTATGRVAILFPGAEAVRRTVTKENNRFADLFRAFAAEGVPAEPVVYHDDVRDQVRDQLRGFDVVLVWVNPVEGGRDRRVLDAMLRDVAAAGTYVSAHPDVILQLGTKEMLYRTRTLGWGCDTHLYTTLDQLRRELPARLSSGGARVLKQNRGNGGEGVWRVERLKGASVGDPTPPVALESIVRVRHARRGALEERMPLSQFVDLCAPYFDALDGRVVDQEYQERLTEGMTRCYLVHDRVAGFGHQAVNALYPAPDGAAPESTPEPGPRYYHPPTRPESQELRHKLEREWIPALQRQLGLARTQLPVIWDLDFLLGPRDADGRDTFVLCEINVSSVAPYPESAVPAIVEATRAQLATVSR